MGDQELFTELKNIALVQSYGSSKLATTRAFSRNSPYLYRKIQAKNRVLKLLFLSSFPFFGPETPLSGYFWLWLAHKVPKLLWEPIFEKVIVWPAWGHFWAEIWKITFFSLKWPKADQKKIFSKIRSHRIFWHPETFSKPKNGVSRSKTEKVDRN